MPQGLHDDHGVGMVGRAAVDGVDLVALGPEHLAVVAVATGLRPTVERFFGVDVVHVAQGDNLEAGLLAVLQLGKTDPTHAHAG